MNYLGMFGPGPNPSASLIQDGKVVALIEEERLNRIKMSPNNLPIQSALKCLEIAGLGLDDIDGIAWGWDCPRYVTEAMERFDQQAAKDGYFDDFSRLQQELVINLYHPVRLERSLQLGLASASKTNTLPPVHYFPHHLCHAASTFYSSGFDEANIITIDGSGEETTALLCKGDGEGITILEQIELPHSLGGFYATFTEFLGFRAYMDEGKVMGLAAYGKYSDELQEKLDKFINYDDKGSFHINSKLRYVGEHTFGARFTDEFIELFGPKRPQGTSAMKAPYPDIAFNLQWRLEQIVIGMARSLFEKTGIRNVCMAGGVAMNCKMNGVIAQQKFVDDIFIQPASADNGVGMGAAQLLAKENGENVYQKMEHAYLGHEFSADEIEKALIESKLPYYKSENIEKEVAVLINEKNIIGWFQGRMEIGARALGNRSILASPVFKSMKDKINLEVKHRENWRPFCPSMKVESYKKYIKASINSPFMILAFEVVDDAKDAIPSCVHVDGTARPQAVAKEHNLRYWTLIDEFEKLSGCGVLINTSFNIQGEPVVSSPQDALRTFGGTGIDVLAIGDFIVKKTGLS